MKVGDCQSVFYTNNHDNDMISLGNSYGGSHVREIAII